MRLFVAINLPDSIKDRIAELHDTSLTGARWSKREQWHITLHFIGETESDKEIREALQNVEADTFSLGLKGTGTFPAKGKPRVLWAGINASPALQVLHQKTGEALQNTGFMPDTRPYHPHLTLARFKYKTPSKPRIANYQKKHEAFETDSFTVSEFALYQSELNPAGAIYTICDRFPVSS